MHITEAWQTLGPQVAPTGRAGNHREDCPTVLPRLQGGRRTMSLL